MRCAVWYIVFGCFLFAFETVKAHPVAEQATEAADSSDEVFQLDLLVDPSKENNFLPSNTYSRTSDTAMTFMAEVPPDSLPAAAFLIPDVQEKCIEFEFQHHPEDPVASTATKGGSFSYTSIPGYTDCPVCVGKDARGLTFVFRPLNKKYIIYGSEGGRLSTFDTIPAETVTIECKNVRGESRVYDLTKCPRPGTGSRQKRAGPHNPFCNLPVFARNELPRNPAQPNNNQANGGNNNQGNGGNNNQGNGGNGNQGNGGNNNPGINNGGNNNQGHYNVRRSIQGNQFNNGPNRNQRDLRNPNDLPFTDGHFW